MGNFTKRLFRTKRFRVGSYEARLRMFDDTRPDQQCQIHDWPTDGIAKRFVEAARDRHPKGVNACLKCLDRVFADRKADLHPCSDPAC